MVDSQTTGARGDFSSTETDELTGQTETLRQYVKDTNSLSTSFVYNFLDKQLGFFCQRYELEKQQIFLGVTLLFFLGLFVFFIFLSWTYYRPIILNFRIKEELAKAEKEKSKKEE